MSKSNVVPIRFGTAEHIALLELRDLLSENSLSDLLRSLIETSLRLQMEKDLHWPVSYTLLSTTSGEAVYRLFLDWEKARARHPGYFFRTVIEMNEVRVVVITPAHTAVKQVDYEASQREVLKNGGFDGDEVDEIISTLKPTWGQEHEVPVPAAEAAIAKKIAAEAAEAVEHTKA